MMKQFSRRNWLATAGGLAIAGLARGADTKSERTLKMGFGTYGLPGYTIEEAIRLVMKTGFDSIEIAAMPGYHGAPDQLPSTARREIRKLLSDSKLKLGALMGLPRPQQTKKTAENNDWVKRMLELATDLAPDEPPIIQSVLGGRQHEWETQKALFRDCLGPWVKLASDAGVKLAIKPHRGHAMSRPEHAVWIIEQLGADAKLTMVYDYSHYAFRNMSVKETVESALRHTGYLVMKDAVQVDGKVQFKLPGETGQTPHAKTLKMFYDHGYRGEVCCEVSSAVWRVKGYDPAAATETCYRNLSKIFVDAGLRTG
ncbi:MAG TPA: hypothetical protein DCY79_12755 [Planctomycetaceae bacterium]|nr:hypothetical protein [Blastopirellula sp.]HAY80669.1 hypothetical protein [Planctomycetaceae bacterium]